MTQIEIGSKWKYKNLPDVYTVIETRQHRVLTEYKVPGIKLKIYRGLVEMNYVPVKGE